MSDKLPRLTANEAEKMLLANGFELSRQKGSHRIYRKEGSRMVVPHHQAKIVKELLALLD